MTPSERDTALVHILTCEECATIHRSVMQLRDGAGAIGGAKSATAGARYRRWSILGGMAAAAAIIVALVINRPSIRT